MKPISWIGIELTNKCNYSCINCPHSPKLLTRPKGFMEFNLFKKVLKQAYEVTNLINISFFGEPLLHPNFIEFMEILNSRPANIKVVINTNFSMATKDILDKIIDIGINQLRISIDAATKETYEIIRPGVGIGLNKEKISHENRFRIIEEKIEYWFSLPNHISTRHVYTVSSKNEYEIVAYINKWKPLLGDNDQILIKSMLTYGGKMSDRIISNNSCNIWDQYQLMIDWEGNITPCNLDTNMDITIGNIYETSFLDMIKSERYIKVMDESKKKIIFPCNKCIDANNYSRNVTIHRNTTNWERKF